MVKRKRIGPCITEEEKHHDEGMTSNVHGERDRISEQPFLEPSSNLSQQVNSLRNRVHATRTAAKEIQGSLECTVQETSLQTEKNSKVLTGQRSSNRIPKRLRKDTSPVGVSTKKPAIKQNVPPGRSKTRRPWELWSVEDKNAFFDALCEYGKDFESIQSYIAQRSKKKGIPANMIKNKDQVRHFYYRTWHKIAKYLDIGEDVRKQAQELYGLVNYAELRKKVGGGLNEKNRQKLNELVFNGVTTVKYKGKKFRIKTPVCRALKKLNNVAEPKEPETEKLPKEIIVEFRPCTNDAWLQVQNLAQNPRVRTKLCLQRRLKTVIEYLQRRWQPYRLKKKEQIILGLPRSTIPSLPLDPSPVLRLKPKRDAAISLLTISAMDNASSADVCLEKYLKHFLQDMTDKEIVKEKKGGRLKSKSVLGTVPSLSVMSNEKVSDSSETQLKSEYRTVEKQVECSTPQISQISVEQLSKECDKTLSDETLTVGILTPPKSVPEQERIGENPVDEAQRSLSLLTSMLNSVDDKCPLQFSYDGVTNKQCALGEEFENRNSPTSECKTIEEIYLNTQQDAENMTLGQLLGMGAEKQILSPSEIRDKNDVCCDNTSVKNETSVDDSDLKSDLCVKRTEPVVENEKLETSYGAEVIRKGWTTENVGMLTIGELYLMLGRPSKILLEYEWEQPEILDTPQDINVAVNEARASDKCSPQQQLKKLTEILRKLVLVASTTFSDFKNRQQTPLSPTSRNNGHSRINSSTPPSGKSTSRSTSKSSSIKTTLKSKLGNNSEKNLISRESASSVNKNSDVAPAKAEASVSTVEACSTTTITTTNAVDRRTPTSDKHVFVVPVGTAPRTVKQPTPESLREQIDKLLPGTRRGCRVRRKPLVVQRPLLPREGMGTVSGPRPMTVVHLVPSGSQLSSLTAVIPSSSTGSGNKLSLPSAKKVVKIVSPGPTIDVRPLQVLKPINADGNANVMLQSSSLPTAHLMVTSSSSSAMHSVDHDVSQSHNLVSNLISPLSTRRPVIESNDDHPVVIQSTPKSQPSTLQVMNTTPSSVTPLSLSVLSASTKCITSISETTVVTSPPQISIPDSSSNTSTIPPPNVSSLLEITLSEGIPSEVIAGHSPDHLLGFGENSNLSATFGLTTALSSDKSGTSEHPSSSIPSCLSSDSIVVPKQNTPPQSPPHSHFRICSPGPEAQWLNGESVEFSLSSLLNTLESPCKILPVSSTTSSLTADNSNLDPIVRLAPDVDSQLQCLMNESSIDYVAKFADLAAQITSTTADGKPT